MAGEPVQEQSSLTDVLWWDPVHLSQGHVGLPQDASDSDDANSIYCMLLNIADLQGLDLDSVHIPSKSCPVWWLHPPKLLFFQPKYCFLNSLFDHRLLSIFSCSFQISVCGFSIKKKTTEVLKEIFIFISGGLTKIWTQIKWFRVQSANHYTTGFCIECWEVPNRYSHLEPPGRQLLPPR